MVKDKDILKVLQLLPKKAQYYFTNAQIIRALPAKELQQKAAAFRLKGESFDEVNKAVRYALQAASVKDLIIVCGSVFVVGEVNVSEIERYKFREKVNSNS
jgi:dihydrofolate synthase/folylpolyglutamate synthase